MIPGGAILTLTGLGGPWAWLGSFPRAALQPQDEAQRLWVACAYVHMFVCTCLCAHQENRHRVASGPWNFRWPRAFPILLRISVAGRGVAGLSCLRAPAGHPPRVPLHLSARRQRAQGACWLSPEHPPGPRREVQPSRNLTAPGFPAAPCRPAPRASLHRAVAL